MTVTANTGSGYRFLNWTENSTVVSTNSSYSFFVTSNRNLVANFIQTFSITTTSSPVAGGSTSGGGTFDSGSPVTVTALSSAGYRFVNWTEGGTPVSTSSSYTFPANADRSLTANFIQTYIISTSSSPVAGGSATGAGTYDSGSSVTVTAIPATGYRFNNWTEGGSPVSTNSSFTFLASANRTLTANFIQIYIISTSSSPVAGGSTTGGGTFDSGTSVTVTATPSTGYRFVNWTEGVNPVSASASYTFSAVANRNLTANFIQLVTITTASSPVAGGSTSGGGTFDSGTSVTVIAAPSAGYRFVSWTESGSTVSTSASYTFIASANRNLIANFILTYSVTTSSSPVAGGTTSGGGTYDSGSQATVIATPSAGYRFVNWTVSGSIVSTASSYSFIVSSNRSLTANFIQVFTVSTSSSPAAGGSTTGSGTYDTGSSVTVTATAATGYRFANWTEGGSIVSSNTSYSFLAASNRTLVANFIRTWTVTTSSSPAAGGSTTGNGTFDSGSSVTVTAVPAAGYRFLNWTEAGSVVSTSAGYTFTASANRTLIANFIQTFIISTASLPTGGGTTTGGGTFDSGSSVTVTATPAAGYRFVNWTEGGSQVSANPGYTFTLTSARSLTANFIQIFTVSTSSNPTAGGSTTGNGTYDSGSSVTVTATAATGYRFSNWTEGGSQVSTSAAYTFAVTANRTLVANFIRTWTVTTSSSPVAGGTTAGGGTFDSGTSVTVTASPAAGYRFVSWTESGSVVSTSAVYTFTPSANRTLIANFVQTFAISTSSLPTGGGTTSGDGTFDSGSSVTVSAIPSEGYRFVNWSEGGIAVSASASYTFTASAGRILTANFIRIWIISLSPNPVSGGTTAGGGTYDNGTQVTVTATPAAGYRFVNWTQDATEISTAASYTFNISGNRMLTANFIRIYTVSLSSNPAAGGTVTGGGTFDTGSAVTLTAVPSSGYRFLNWTEGTDVLGAGTGYSFIISSNRSITANFIRIYTIRTSSVPEGGGTTSGGGSYDSGSSITVTATPASGYRFVRWTEGGSSVSVNASYSFISNSDRNLVAEFIRIFTVTTSSMPATGGTTAGSGLFDQGSQVTVTATPSAGYRFTNWTENGSAVSTNQAYTFTISGNRTLTANFSRITHTVTTSSSPAAGGTTTGGGTYNWGSTVTVTASSALGYKFNGWTEGSATVSANESYTFTITSNRILIASFSLIPVIFHFKGPDGKDLRNNDTILINSPDSGSFSLKVESNFDWSVTDNSIWLKTSRTNGSSLKLTYMENISVYDKIAVVTIENQLKNKFSVNIKQKARISHLHISKFGEANVYPNPITDFIHISFGNEKFEQIRIMILNIQGFVIFDKEYKDISAGQILELSLASFPSGQYLLNLNDGLTRKSISLIKY